ncbi:cytochrome b5-like heme/steroid binding domain-containing protein [Roridomyces roridus]|uniref:Cytochrome b5-like heme/steroid binding domain-containing protein n=1 Tax=Roridomyces roridus TaxID=1738132 RepID=A0AAD7FU99_9AGAR|nr:cytochrome b5-like heme/steroid binding domain-containing protein [Roridomyces roridus]
MSWMSGLTGQEPERYVPPPDELKVPDPSIPDRMVSAKSANQPFLAHKEYRDRQEALHQAWLEKKKIRDAKIAKGEPVGPLERDPTAPTEVGLLGLLKFLLYTTIALALAGKFVTGSYTWEYETRLLQLKSFIPVGTFIERDRAAVETGHVQTNQRLFSESGLKQYNGEGSFPTYLAIDGDVYDVSKGQSYQPGGSYHFMTGTDAARAFGTGCFQTHKTHDLRGLSEQEMAGVQHWKQFFANHDKYAKVGRVSHPPIDPASPIPEHCDAKKQAIAEEEGRVPKRTASKKADDEL